MQRAEFPVEKDVFILTDYPILKELSNDMEWSSPGNLENLSWLRQAGITYEKIHTSYLSYDRPTEEIFENQISLKETSLHTNKVEFKNKTFFLEDNFLQNIQECLKEIRKVKPKLIICFGKWSLFFLAEIIEYKNTIGTKKDPRIHGAIAKYRISTLGNSELIAIPCVVVPLYPSSEIHRDPSKLFTIQQDFEKIGNIYKNISSFGIDYYLIDSNEYILGDSVEKIKAFLQPYMDRLDSGEVLKASIDIETRGFTIDCVGIGFDSKTGICVPFSLYSDPEPWSFEEELELYQFLFKLLSNHNLRPIGQNFGYDSAYFYHYFCLFIIADIDTMIRHHTFFNSVPKSLDFLASIYCEIYRYWKNEREK